MIKTYLDRKNPEEPYVFISYSHYDTVEIEKILTALSDAGANFWYDIKLRRGKDWTKIVDEVTSNKNCVGIIYFISENFIYSEACIKEFQLFEKLTKTHDKFEAYYVLLGDEEIRDWTKFVSNAMKKLFGMYPENPDRITKHYNIIKTFNTDILFLSLARNAVEDEEIVKLIFKDTFAAWGCASEETDKIGMLADEGLVDNDYHIKAYCSINEGKKSEEVEWKVFAYSGNTISAILVSDELFAATSLSFVESTMDSLNKKVNSTNEKTPRQNNEVSGKYLIFDEDFLRCVKTDEKGKRIRFLRAAEHEAHYLQLKEALETVSLNNVVDDGYFFVHGKDKVLFADRGSADVYRHIHVDAYASIIPVIDIDYEKYKQYVKNKNRA